MGFILNNGVNTIVMVNGLILTHFFFPPLTFVRSLIGDDKKSLLTNEKFLSVASEDTLLHLTLLAERLLFDHAAKMKANPKGSRQFHHVLVNNAVSALGWNLRKQALNSIKKIMAGLGQSSHDSN